MMKVSDASREGRQAYLAGGSLHKNPYRKTQPSFFDRVLEQVWALSWVRAQAAAEALRAHELVQLSRRQSSNQVGAGFQRLGKPDRKDGRSLE